MILGNSAKILNVMNTARITFSLHPLVISTNASKKGTSYATQILRLAPKKRGRARSVLLITSDDFRLKEKGFGGQDRASKKNIRELKFVTDPHTQDTLQNPNKCESHKMIVKYELLIG